MDHSTTWMDCPSFEHYTILGIPVHTLKAVSSSESVTKYAAWIRDQIEAGQGGHIVTCNAEMIMMAQNDPAFARLIQAATVVPPDGAGVVWALRRQGIVAHRSPGIEIAEALLRLAAQHYYTVALIGGLPHVIETATVQLQSYHPQLQLWSHHGYFTPEQERSILDHLSNTQPPLIFVGLGSPRQEFWIQAHQAVSPQSMWIGVGGSFDIWGGIKQRAPLWLREHQLEWLYRLYQEPWRWRRMLALPQFVVKVLQS